MNDSYKTKSNGKERIFHFKVPTAWDGAAIFDYLTAYGIPFSPAGKSMPPDELKALMQLCLKYCFEELPGNPAQVVDSEGNLGIINATAPLITRVATKYMLFFWDWWKSEMN